MAIGSFISVGRSLRRCRRARPARRGARLRRGVRDPHRGARLADGARRLRGGDVAHRPGHRRGADLHAHAGDDGHDGGHAARAVRAGACAWASASRTAPSSRAGTGRRSTSPWPRCASTSPSCARSSRGEPPPAGEKWQTSFALSGIGPYPDLPIYVAALSPAMLRLAGEVADGVDAVAVQPRVHPRRRHARGDRPGASAPARRSRASTSWPPSRRPIVDDPGAALAAMRRDLLTYFGLPFYRAMLERSGFGEDIAAYDEAAARGDGEAMQAAISERFLHALCAIGSPEDVRAGVARYPDAGATSPCVGPIARTDFEATLRAARARAERALRARPRSPRSRSRARLRASAPCATRDAERRRQRRDAWPRGRRDLRLLDARRPRASEPRAPFPRCGSGARSRAQRRPTPPSAPIFQSRPP